MIAVERCGPFVYFPTMPPAISTKELPRVPRASACRLRTTLPCFSDEEPLPAAGSGRVPSDKVKALADEICGLTMLEVSDLTTLLKDTLNIPDSAMPMGMPMGMPRGMPMGGAAAEEPEEEEEEQTEFDVKLEAYVCHSPMPC
jgi:large subunit ribosomal protein L7/L12